MRHSHSFTTTTATKNVSNYQNTFLFGCTAQSERMPFIFRDGRYVDEHIIAGSKIEMMRSFDDQMGDLRWQQNTR